MRLGLLKKSYFNKHCPHASDGGSALGNGVYEKISTERLGDIAEKLGIKNMVLGIAESDTRMIDIDRRLKKELDKTEEKKP